MVEYQKQIIDICKDIEKHGYGICKIQFEDKGYKVKIVIEAGKSYVYFIDKPPKRFVETTIM